MQRKTRIELLLVVAVLFAGGALLTLVPATGSAVSDLGYRSLCPFAPWSTLILLFAAGLAMALRSYLRSQPG